MATNPNMVAIQTVTVGSGGAASIDFTNIPQTYTDLVIKASLRSNQNANTGENVRVRFNGSTASVYSWRYIEGNGSSASSASGSGETSLLAAYANTNNTTSNTFGNLEMYIPNYTSTTNAKSMSADSVVETNATLAFTFLSANLWNPATQAAITSITLYPQVASLWNQYSTATLYGVTSADYGAKATGGIVTSDENYWYHTFTSTGTFTPTQSITADCLVVAGGGGGGGASVSNFYAGGGGAGGVLGFASQSLTATGYTVTVGGGGSAGTGGTLNVATDGGNGSNSQFGSLTACVGGGGGASRDRASKSGGSGGGASSYNITTTRAGGAATSGQGNAGGSSTTNYYSGGGGGAGAAGATGNGATGTGYGGDGTNNVTNWGSLSAVVTATGIGNGGYLAGGGQGSAPIAVNSALGGGGSAGGDSGGSGGTPATAGATNTGSGGGAGSANGTQNGAAGGSGIVVIRYAK